MPPTPYVPGGKLRTTYIVGGLTHHYDVPCNIAVEAGSSSLIENNIVPAADPTIQEAGDSIWDLVRVHYTNTVLAPVYTLYKRDENIFIPVGSDNATNAGASGVAYSPTTQMTLTFRDISQYLFKLVLLETINPSPNRGLPNSPANVAAIFDGFVQNVNDHDPHNWVLSRAALSIDRGLNWTVSDNRKLRRARGLL